MKKNSKRKDEFLLYLSFIGVCIISLILFITPFAGIIEGIHIICTEKCKLFWLCLMLIPMAFSTNFTLIMLMLANMEHYENNEKSDIKKAKYEKKQAIKVCVEAIICVLILCVAGSCYKFAPIITGIILIAISVLTILLFAIAIIKMIKEEEVNKYEQKRHE